MKCIDGKHLHEGDDPGGGSWTGPGRGEHLSCAFGKWYLDNSQLTRADLRVAVRAAEECQQFEPEPT